MASATITVTLTNIADRKSEILRYRRILRTPGINAAKKSAITAKITELLTEIAALKASLHYYKPEFQLASDISGQRRKVIALTAVLKKAGGRGRSAVGKQLRREAKSLNEMLAAAQAQQSHPGLHASLPQRKPTLSLVRENPIGTEADALAAEAEGPPHVPAATPAQAAAVEAAGQFQPSEFSLSDAPDFAQRALTALDEVDDYVNEEGEVWYKNPIVLVAAGVTTWLILRRL